VTWDIPSSLPNESYHLGVKASNNDGEFIETWIVTIGNGKVIYIGPEETITTLKEGMKAIESGDTLVMRNGIWLANGGDNNIPGGSGKLQKLPSGNAENYTTLMAEDPGQVILDGNNEDSTIRLFGSSKHPDWPLDNNGFTGTTDYLAIKGIALINSYTEAMRIDYSHHIKLINMGFGNSTSIQASSYPNLYVHRSHHIIVEGAYAWGHGRYKIQFKNSSEAVVRRSVVRIDDIRIDNPIGGYISYCSKNIAFQNVIVVDGDKSEFWFNYNEIAGAFGVPATNCHGYPENNLFTRALVLNTHLGVMQTQARDNPNPTIWQDVVGWDLASARGADLSVNMLSRLECNNIFRKSDFL